MKKGGVCIIKGWRILVNIVEWKGNEASENVYKCLYKDEMGSRWKKGVNSRRVGALGGCLY